MAGTTKSGIELCRIARGESFPLSYVQSYIWYHPLWNPGLPSHFWHQPLSLRISGKLEYELLRRSWAKFIARHESARTVFTESTSGQPRQHILASGPDGLPVVDLRSLAPSVRFTEAERHMRETLQQPFDLAAMAPIRTLLLRLDDESHLFFFSVHHLIADGWSQGVFLRELVEDYDALRQGRSSKVRSSALEYVDYAVWHRRATESGGLDKMIDYWVEQLSPPFAGIRLPTEPPTPGSSPYAGAIERFNISSELMQRAHDVGKTLGTTIFGVALAGLYLVLHAWTRQVDLLVSVPVANRSTSKAFWRVFGCFSRQLPFRVNLDDDPTFAQLVRRVAETNLRAHANQEAPIVKAVERLGFAHAPQAAIGKVVFIYQNAVLARMARDEIAFDVEMRWDLPGLAREDMVWQLFESAVGLEGWLEYRTGLYAQSTMAQLTADYVSLLGQALDASDRRISAFSPTRHGVRE